MAPKKPYKKKVDDSSWVKHAWDDLQQNRIPAPATFKGAASSGPGGSGLSRAMLDAGPVFADDVSRHQELRRARKETATLCTGFEPQRHSMIVAGRPVQVHLQHSDA